MFRVPTPQAELTTEQPPQHLHTPDTASLGSRQGGEVLSYRPFSRVLGTGSESPHGCHPATVTMLLVWVWVRWLAPPQTPGLLISFLRLGPSGNKEGSETHSEPLLALMLLKLTPC